jgi:hypothetical protein
MHKLKLMPDRLSFSILLLQRRLRALNKPLSRLLIPIISQLQLPPSERMESVVDMTLNGYVRLRLLPIRDDKEISNLTMMPNFKRTGRRSLNMLPRMKAPM